VLVTTIGQPMKAAPTATQYCVAEQVTDASPPDPSTVSKRADEERKEAKCHEEPSLSVTNMTG
jgi:hypothetical protein